MLVLRHTVKGIQRDFNKLWEKVERNNKKSSNKKDTQKAKEKNTNQNKNK